MGLFFKKNHHYCQSIGPSLFKNSTALSLFNKEVVFLNLMDFFPFFKKKKKKGKNRTRNEKKEQQKIKKKIKRKKKQKQKAIPKKRRKENSHPRLMCLMISFDLTVEHT